MPTNDKLASAARARLARLYINGGTPDPELETAIRREIKETELSKAIQRAIDSIPPLTDEQRHRIAAILTTGGGR